MGNCAPKGSFLFNIYDDLAVNSTLEYLYKNSVVKGNYYEACFNFVKIVNGLYVQKQNNKPHIGGGGNVPTIPLFELLVISFALSFIIVIILVKVTSNSNRFKYSLNDNIKESSLNIACDYDKMI